ncbi:MAG: helix-turn-helix domain-containing protein [Deltaproteobacteria bacterium]|nr:helix-turn-helix domain-containing protein [Deltaproteobacteria bacterium]
MVRAYDEGEGTYREVAERFGVGEATVSRWLRLQRVTGALEPLKTKRGFPSMLTPAVLELLLGVLEERPDLTRPELAERVVARGGPPMSPATVGRALKRLGWSRKKKGSEPARWTRTASRRSARAT